MHVVIRDRDKHIWDLLPLAFWSVNSRFGVTHHIYYKIFNKSLHGILNSHLVAFCVQNSAIVHHGTRFSHCRCHCKTVSEQLLFDRESNSKLRGVGLTDRSTGCYKRVIWWNGGNTRTFLSCTKMCVHKEGTVKKLTEKLKKWLVKPASVVGRIWSDNADVCNG